MEAALFAELSGPEGIDVREVDDPVPDAGEAVLSVEASAINRHDLWILEGDSAMVASDNLPYLSGLDGAGVVEEVGPGVDAVAPGDRVVLCPNQTCGTCQYCREGPENRCEGYGLFHGTFAERAAVEADRLVALPDGVSTPAAAALPTAYMTAWHMLRRAGATAGDLVFVPGATGGVGVAAVQLLDALGATSIGTSRSAEKLARLAEVGADHTIESDDPADIEGALDGIGTPDAAVNHLGGAFTDLCLRAVGRGGRVVVCGRTAGGTSEIDIPELYLSHAEIVGSTMGTQGDLERLVGLVADGAFDPVVGAEYALDDAGEAFAEMRDRDLFGKVLLRS